MADEQTGTSRGADSAVPDPATWRTGDEPPTQRQAAYLERLAEDAGADVNPESMTKAEVSEAIDDLKSETGR
jgi:hypothetical protein